MQLMEVETYNKFLHPFNILFYITLISYILKEFFILFSIDFIVFDIIPELVYLIIIGGYAIYYIVPYFKPDLINGFELPSSDQNLDNKTTKTTKEKELDELRDISL